MSSKKTKNRFDGHDAFLVSSTSKRTKARVVREVEYCPRCQGTGCEFCKSTDPEPARKATHRSIRAGFKAELVDRLITDLSNHTNA